MKEIAAVMSLLAFKWTFGSMLSSAIKKLLTL